MPIKPRSFAEDIGYLRTLRDDLSGLVDECKGSRIHKVKGLAHYAMWANRVIDYAIERQGLRLWETRLPSRLLWPNIACSLGDTSQWEVDLEYKEGKEG